MRDLKPTLLDSARNSVWLIAIPAARMAIGFTVGLMVTRHLGPEQFGRLSEALALLTMASPLADLGLTAFVRAELLGKRFPSDELLASILGLRLLGAAASTVTALIVAAHSAPPILELTFAASLTLFMPVFLTPEQWFTSRLSSRIPSIVQLSAIGIGALLRLVLIATHAPLIAFAACVSVEALATGVGLFIALSREVPLHPRRFSSKVTAPALRASLPLLLTVLALAVQTRVDQLLLARFAGATELGLYASCVRFSELLNVVLSALCLSLLPAFAAALENDPERPAFALRDMLDFLTSVAVAWAIFCSATAWWWVPKLLGTAFTTSGLFLTVHAWTCVFQAMGISRSTLWTLQQRNDLTLVATLIGASLSTALNYVFVPRYGAWACVACAIVGAAVTNLFTTVIGPRGRQVLWAQLQGVWGVGRLWRHRALLLARDEPGPPSDRPGPADQ